MSNLVRELVRLADKRGLVQTVPRSQRVYSEQSGSFHSPDDDRVDALNSQTGDVTLAVSGGLLTINTAAGTITIGLTEAAIQALFTGYGQVYSEEFSNQTVWTVTHSLGAYPAITVWEYDGALGFGSQAFGTSAFGGTIGTPTENTDGATIEIVDDDELTVTWVSGTYGKVVCVA